MTIAEIIRTRSSLRSKFTFETTCRWTGGRTGLIEADYRPTLQVSGTQQLSDNSGEWTPEELLVAEIGSCTMMTFLTLAERNSLPVAWYASVAEGVLEKLNAKARVTRIMLRPTVALRLGESADLAFQLLRQAQDQCAISKSLGGRLWFEPSVETFGD